MISFLLQLRSPWKTIKRRSLTKKSLGTEMDQPSRVPHQDPVRVATMYGELGNKLVSTIQPDQTPSIFPI
jgi:hypothetical protein